MNGTRRSFAAHAGAGAGMLGADESERCGTRPRERRVSYRHHDGVFSWYGVGVVAHFVAQTGGEGVLMSSLDFLKPIVQQKRLGGVENSACANVGAHAGAIAVYLGGPGGRAARNSARVRNCDRHWNTMPADLTGAADESCFRPQSDRQNARTC